MELWIRTQDRLELIKAKDIKIFDCEKQKEKYEKSLLGVITQEPYNRTGFEISSCGNVFGVYKTKERALEVLNEISDRIATLTAIELMGINDTNVKVFRKYLEENNCSVVYQMPKE